MQSYTTIIGVLEMRSNEFSYRDIRARYGLGQGTVKLLFCEIYKSKHINLRT